MSALTLATLLPVLLTPFLGAAAPASPSPSAPSGSLLRVPVLAQVGGGEEADATAEPEEAADGEATPTTAPADGPPPARTTDSGLSREEIAAQLRTRDDISGVHRALGIATWVSMLATVTLGTFQYYNLYGFGAGQNDNPCTTGEGIIFGPETCTGTPLPHRISAITTTVLYTATFSLSLFMPDPNRISEMDSDYGRRVRAHKILRWVHLGGMVAQLFLGLAAANDWFGTDRPNDYDALRAIASVHMGLGWVTFGSLSAAAALVLF